MAANKINKEWHEMNPMPEEPTLEQLITWHVLHARHCGCRKIPARLMEIIKQRNIKIFEEEP